jgi:hypothetical protein
VAAVQDAVPSDAMLAGMEEAFDAEASSAASSMNEEVLRCASPSTMAEHRCPKYQSWMPSHQWLSVFFLDRDRGEMAFR